MQTQALETVKVSLYFPPAQTDKPVIYHLVKDYDLIINIQQAEIGPGKRGKTVMDLTGTRDNLESGLMFLSEQGVGVRMFSTNIIHNEDKCVNCGACVSVCPSGALSMGYPEWTLHFDTPKCLRCKQCVGACPMRAIDVSLFA